MLTLTGHRSAWLGSKLGSARHGLIRGSAPLGTALFGAQWDSETNFPPTNLIRAASTAFTSYGLRTSHGLARSSARFGSRSGSEFGLTQGWFLGSRNGDSEEKQVKNGQKKKWVDEKTRTKNTARKSIMEPPEDIHLASFRNEQRQQAPPGGKIYALGSYHACLPCDSVVKVCSERGDSNAGASVREIQSVFIGTGLRWV